MKKALTLIALVAFVPGIIWAQDRVLPAQADDIARVDAALATANTQMAQVKRSGEVEESGSEEDQNSFGAQVSQEAKALKDADLETRKKFGASVAERRRKDKGVGAEAAQRGRDMAPSNTMGQVPPSGGTGGGGFLPSSPGRR